MNNRVECLQKNKPRREKETEQRKNRKETEQRKKRKETEQRKKWNTNKKGKIRDNFV